MNAPRVILHWILKEVKPMRRSRQKTLADIVSAAMRLSGSGVLSLGRAIPSKTSAKHSIKRVWRFFKNRKLKVFSVQQALVNCLSPQNAPVIILLDWTIYGSYQTLVAAIPRDGRSIPICWKTIFTKSGEGIQKQAEKDLLFEIRQLFPFRKDLILIADRGFGNTRWLTDIENWGWGYVQRISGSVYVEKGEYYRPLNKLPLLRGAGSCDWGEVLITKESKFKTRLVSTWHQKAKQLWFLATNLDKIPQKIMRLYQRRMWIEAMFRDLKNRKWGLGFAGSNLLTQKREDRRWAVLALAYMFLMAYGAAAEEAGLAGNFVPNTVREREMNLARLGYFIIQTAMQSIQEIILALNRLQV